MCRVGSSGFCLPNAPNFSCVGSSGFFYLTHQIFLLAFSYQMHQIFQGWFGMAEGEEGGHV